jgi:hypothetical protein
VNLRERKADGHIVNAEILQEREILADDVVRAFRRGIAMDFRIERTRRFLAEVPDRKADHARGTGRTREHRRLHQSLEINRDVVLNLLHAPRHVEPSCNRRPLEWDHAIDAGDQVDDRPMLRFDEPVNPGVGKRVPQRCRGGYGMYDVAQRTEPDDQNVHPRIRARRSRVE